MGDMHSKENRFFWAGNRTFMEPAKDKRFNHDIIESYRYGRHFYLTSAVSLGLRNFGCPAVCADQAKQRAFESGFGVEISDCLQIVRGNAHG